MALDSDEGGIDLYRTPKIARFWRVVLVTPGQPATGFTTDVSGGLLEQETIMQAVYDMNTKKSKFEAHLDHSILY